MPKPQTSPPHEVFALMQSWWALQAGFGLAYLFSDDALALHWLRLRMQEEVQRTPHAKVHGLIDFKTWDEGDPGQLFAPAHLGKTRCLHWIVLANGNHAQWLGRLNEQRQRLIASEHLFVIALPTQLALEAAGSAPDLWSVRSHATYLQSPPAASPTFRSHSHSKFTPVAQAQSLTPAADQSLSMAAWHSLFAQWSNPALQRRQLSPRLGLQTLADAIGLQQFKAAQQIGQQLIEVTQAQRDDLGHANTLKALGDLDHRLGQVDSARSLYLQAIALYEKEQSDLGRANALKALGDLGHRSGQIDSVRTLYLQALALFEKVQNDLGRANTLNALGDLDHRLGQVDSARSLYLQAIALYEKEQVDLGRANTLRALGDLDHRLGQVDSARALYRQAIALYEKEQIDLGRANTLRALGDLDHRLGQADSARTLYLQAIALFEKEQNDLGRANTLKALGDLDGRLGQVDSARTLYPQAIALYEKEQVDLGRANTLQALGDLDHRLGQVDSARTLYLQAIALYEKEHDTIGLAYSHAKLAVLEGCIESHHAEKACIHAQQSGSKAVIADVRRILQIANPTI